MKKLLEEVDVLVDGRFLIEEKSLDIYYRGSKNQRIIDVKKSLEEGKVVEIEKFKGTKIFKPMYNKEKDIFI